MSISTLVTALKKLATEKSQAKKAEHFEDIIMGIQEIGARLAELEKRVDALEEMQ